MPPKKVSQQCQSWSRYIKRVFRYFGETACETPVLLDRLLLTMVLKRADIISQGFYVVPQFRSYNGLPTLERMQHPLTQQWESCLAISHTLEKL